MSKVLVLEDDDDQALLLVSHLKGAGHTVERAITAREARGILERFSPDIVLVDLIVKDAGVPIPDGGFSFIARLREMPQFADIPVVVTTAMAFLLSQQWLEGYGVAKVYEKPFAMQDLVDQLGEFCGGAEMAASG